DFLGFQRAGAVNDPDVVLGVDGNPDGIAHHPMIRQRLGPHGIDFEPGRRYGGSLDRGPSVDYGRCDAKRDQEAREGCSGAEFCCHDCSSFLNNHKLYFFTYFFKSFGPTSAPYTFPCWSTATPSAVLVEPLGSG